MTPLSPGFDFDRYDRETRQPLPSAPQLSAESAVWHKEHDISHTALNNAASPVRASVAVAPLLHSTIFPGELR
jgi:NAD(P)H dehydrogenase (quinone)